MIPWNRFLPCLRFQYLSILQQIPCVHIVEILAICGHREMSSPGERSSFERENALSLSAYRGYLRMRIVPVICETLKIILRTPRVRVSILSLPMDRRFLVCLVSLDSPFPRPWEPFAPDVAAFFDELRRRKLRSGRAVNRHHWQNNPRSTASAEFQRGRHRIWCRQNHGPQCVRNGYTDTMALRKYPGGQVHCDIERIGFAGF